MAQGTGYDKFAAFAQLVKLGTMPVSIDKAAAHYKTHFGNNGMVDELFSKIKEIEGSLNIISPDKDIKEQIKVLPDKKLKELLAKYVDAAPIKGWGNVGDMGQLDDVLRRVITHIINMRIKHNFMLYQYVQANGLIPMLANAAKDIISDMHTAMLSLMVQQKQAGTEVVENILKAIESAASYDVDKKQIAEVQSKIDQYRASSDKQLEKVLGDLVEKSKKIQMASTQELIKWLAEQSLQFREQVVESVKTTDDKS